MATLMCMAGVPHASKTEKESSRLIKTSIMSYRYYPQTQTEASPRCHHMAPSLPHQATAHRSASRPPTPPRRCRAGHPAMSRWLGARALIAPVTTSSGATTVNPKLKG